MELSIRLLKFLTNLDKQMHRNFFYLLKIIPYFHNRDRADTVHSLLQRFCNRLPSLSPTFLVYPGLGQAPDVNGSPCWTKHNSNSANVLESFSVAHFGRACRWRWNIAFWWRFLAAPHMQSFGNDPPVISTTARSLGDHYIVIIIIIIRCLRFLKPPGTLSQTGTFCPFNTLNSVLMYIPSNL